MRGTQVDLRQLEGQPGDSGPGHGDGGDDARQARSGTLEGALLPDGLESERIVEREDVTISARADLSAGVQVADRRPPARGDVPGHDGRGRGGHPQDVRGREATLGVELGDGAFGTLVVGRFGGPPDGVPLGRVGGEAALAHRARQERTHQSTTRRHCSDGVTLRIGSGSYSRWMITR